MTKGLRDSLTLARWLTVNAPPRTFNPWASEACNLIFVDGAAEGEGRQLVSIGAVLFSPKLAHPQFFGLKVEDDLVAHWMSQGSKQVICQAEIFPVVVAKMTWSDILINGRNLWFEDNEAARESFVKSYSTSWSARELLLLGKIEDARTEAFDWYSRVPTAANWADGPSRLDYADMNLIQAREIEPRVPSLAEITGVDVAKSLAHVFHSLR
jgi:hypothetical protein